MKNTRKDTGFMPVAEESFAHEKDVKCCTNFGQANNGNNMWYLQRTFKIHLNDWLEAKRKRKSDFPEGFTAVQTYSNSTTLFCTVGTVCITVVIVLLLLFWLILINSMCFTGV